MANKNSKQRRQAIARAAKQSFRGQRRKGGLLIISDNPNRGMQQVVYRNSGGGSITCHEPIYKNGNFRTPNHGYLEGTYKSRVKAYGGTKHRSEAPAEGFEFDNSVVHV